jgi:hypothetical protein
MLDPEQIVAKNLDEIRMKVERMQGFYQPCKE